MKTWQIWPRRRHRAGADADVNVEVVEIDAVERLVERAQGADLVDQPDRPAARDRQTDPGAAGLALDAFGLGDKHVASINTIGQFQRLPTSKLARAVSSAISISSPATSSAGSATTPLSVVTPIVTAPA